MKKKKNIFNGVIVLIISQCIVKVLGLVYKLYLANKEGFGDAGNAIYNAGYQIYALLLTISSIGVPNAVAKLIAEKKFTGNNIEIAKILKSSLIIFSIIGIIGSGLLAISADFISNKLLNIKEAKYTIIALSPAIFNVCLISVYRGFYNGLNNIKITANSQTIEQILKTVFTIILVEIIFVLTNANTVAMAAIANFATTLATLCSFIYLYKKNSLKNVHVKFERRNVCKILKISIPISLSAILASLNRNIDSITVVRFLKHSIGNSEAKIQYGILSGKIDVISSLPVSFIIAIATTIIPTVSLLNAQRNNKSLRKMVKTYILFTILLIFPCSIGMIAFSDQILQLLFNSSNGSMLLKVSAISMIFISIEQITHAVLQGMGKVFVPTIALFIGVVIKVILNIILIRLPQSYYIGGTVGACVATLMCHIIASSISFSVMRKKLNIKLELLKYILKPAVSSCIMLLCLYSSYFLLKGIIIENIAIILAILVATFMYIASIFILRILNDEELRMIPFVSNIIDFNEKIKFIRKNKEKRRILHKFGE